MQSETGSGKTLAYLLPIIQVSDPADADAAAYLLSLSLSTRRSLTRLPLPPTPSFRKKSLAIDPVTFDPKKPPTRTELGTRALILCPTRELALQTQDVTERLCRSTFSFLVPGCLSGGERRKSKKAKLRKGVTIFTATPGRMLDHLDKTSSLLLSLKGRLEFLILDEADRLLDMGLGGQVERIVQTVRANQPGSGRGGGRHNMEIRPGLRHRYYRH